MTSRDRYRHWGRCIGATAGAFGLAVLAGPAAAVSIGFADVSILFTLKAVNDIDRSALRIGASADLAEQGRETNPGGSASGNYEASVLGSSPSFWIGDELQLGSTASALAVGPLGLADSFTYTDGMLSITNGSEDRARLRFGLSYDLSAFVSVADPNAEYGTGRSFLGVESTSSGVLFQASAEADSVFGPPSHSIADSLRLVLNVRPGATETIFLVADSEASAASLAAVPLPSALSGLLAALGVLVAVARRHGSRSASRLA